MSDFEGPLVSVGVPVFNGGAKIEAALQSVLNQTYTNIQVLISDNASTDNTREVCERICTLDSRVHYVRQAANFGPSANFKAVLGLAEGDYFMWLGHDDWLSERYVERCVETLNKNVDVSIACGQAIYYQDGHELNKGVEVQLPQEYPQERVLAFYSLVVDNGTFYGLMRREQLLRVKMNEVMGGDWLMIASIAFLGKVLTLPSISVHRAVGGSSVSYENIVSTLGASKLQAVFPHVAVAFFAVRDIAWRDPLYSLKRRERWLLAWRSQRIIRLRHGSSFVGILRKCRDLAKEFFQRLIGSAQRKSNTRS